MLLKMILKLFEVDNRGTSLFVELVYPNDIDESDSIYSKTSKLKLEKFKSYIAFVAIKKWGTQWDRLYNF